MHKARRQRYKRLCISRAAHDDRIELTREPGYDVFRSRIHDLDAREAKLANGRGKKGRAPLASLDQYKCCVGPHDFDGDPWEPGAGAEVSERSEPPWESSKEHEAVQKQIFHDPIRTVPADQPRRSLPFK